MIKIFKKSSALKQRFILLPLFLLLLICVFTSCAHDKEQKKGVDDAYGRNTVGRQYENRKADFGVTIPKRGWQRIHDCHENLCLQSRDYTIDIILNSEKYKNETLEQAVKEIVDRYSEIDKAEVLSSEEFEIAGQKALKTELKARVWLRGNPNVWGHRKIIIYVLTNGKKLFSVEYIAKEEDFEIGLADLQELIETFKMF